jgi:predicted ATP-grasp superfamily ATP-dependent carboligase
MPLSLVALMEATKKRAAKLKAKGATLGFKELLRFKPDSRVEVPPPSRLRILLSEGSSTSAREAITILGMQGHHVEVCDPNPCCFGRFSRFVRRFHRCPGLGADPVGYVTFVLELLGRRRFDVLLPIHEQGYALSKAREAIENRVAVALPSHAAYQKAHSKASFSRLLSCLDLPQPRTLLVRTREDVLALDRFPLMLKAATGTASRAVWLVQKPHELAAAVRELARGGAFADDVVAQEFIDAPVEHAQAVVSRGRLLGMHAYRQIARGAGGGDAMKESVHRPLVREHLTRIGKHLDWHGALSVDYLAPAENDVRYIDCNPRLVEPMNALLAGHDLLNLLLQVTREASPEPLAPCRAGVRTHLALQTLLGCAMQTQSRVELLSECWRLLTRTGVYQYSEEELTPLRIDSPSVIPTVFTAAWLLIQPGAAEQLANRGWGDHLLNSESIRIIEGWNGSPA